MFLDDIFEVYGTLNCWLTDSNVELRLMAKRIKEKI